MLYCSTYHTTLRDPVVLIYSYRPTAKTLGHNNVERFLIKCLFLIGGMSMAFIIRSIMGSILFAYLVKRIVLLQNYIARCCHTLEPGTTQNKISANLLVLADQLRIEVSSPSSGILVIALLSITEY